MQSWKSSAVLATMGLSGLGSLLAQETLPPVPAGAAPVSEPVQPLHVDPRIDAPAPLEVAPAPVPEPAGSWEPVSHDSWVSGPASGASCGCGGSVLMAAPAPSCGCQGGMMMPGGYGYGASYTQGSGSGVSSGVLSPNANSGGLHTRYPYYNYRHPWYYQGPPSQNVTIIW